MTREEIAAQIAKREKEQIETVQNNRTSRERWAHSHLTDFTPNNQRRSMRRFIPTLRRRRGDNQQEA